MGLKRRFSEKYYKNIYGSIWNHAYIIHTQGLSIMSLSLGN